MTKYEPIGMTCLLFLLIEVQNSSNDGDHKLGYDLMVQSQCYNAPHDVNPTSNLNQ